MMKKWFGLGLGLALVLVVAIGVLQLNAAQIPIETSNDSMKDSIGALQQDLAVATFAGGCFWCVESGLERVKGVHEAISGYSGGDVKSPTYRQVASGRTGHIESVQVYYDPAMVSYEELLEALWRQIDPTDSEGQFSDRGNQYRPAVFYHDEKERMLAKLSLDKLGQSGRYADPVTLELIPFKNFYEAEARHQDYYKKHPFRFKFYRALSGRDRFLKKVWGNEVYKAAQNSTEETKVMSNDMKPQESYTKPSADELKAKLTDMQYKVTQKEGTEPSFNNEYWDEKRAGIYVDIVSGEPLFSSKDKYDSGTGWPSFTKPIIEDNIITKTDYKMIYPRKELRSQRGDTHLGHVFSDGPAPTGLRYCINSASLRFIPREGLEKEGYSEYLTTLEDSQSI